MGGFCRPYFVLWLPDSTMSGSFAQKPPGLSIFFPAYNDAGTIASMVIRALKAASELTSDFEIIVVDDGSADSTAEIADELARTYPRPGFPPPHEPRLRRGATNRFSRLDQRAHFLYRWRRAVRPGRAFTVVGERWQRTSTS